MTAAGLVLILAGMTLLAAGAALPRIARARARRAAVARLLASRGRS